MFYNDRHYIPDREKLLSITQPWCAHFCGAARKMKIKTSLHLFFNITGHGPPLSTELLPASCIHFLFVRITWCWHIAAPDIPNSRQTSVKYWTIFGEVFPPLYQKRFKVDPLDSKHPTICIHRLIERVEIPLRACFATVKFGLTDKWNNTITPKGVTILGPQGKVCVCGVL